MTYLGGPLIPLFWTLGDLIQWISQLVGVTTPGGVPTYYSGHFPHKLHKNENILDMGAHSLAHTLL